MAKRCREWACAVSATGLVAVVLVGCGSVSARSAGAQRVPGGGRAVFALCSESSRAAQARVTQLGGLLSRTAPGPSRHDAPGPSGVVTGIVARSLALALCSLPSMPPGTSHCPALLFDEYRVVFVADGQVLPAVMVQAAGCRRVTGLGRVRWAQHSAALLEELARIATGTQ